MKLRYLFLLFLAASCSIGIFGSKESKQSAYKKRIDEYIFKNQDDFKYYVKVKTMTKPYQVVGDNWPDEQECSYSVMPDKKGNIIFVKIQQNGEWGDYTLDYKYYFDKKGRTVAFERYNRFFHSVCLNSDVVHEVRDFYYDKNFKLIGKDFSFTTPDGKKLDTLKCDFPYNYPYKIYGSWNEIKELTKLDE